MFLEKLTTDREDKNINRSKQREISVNAVFKLSFLSLTNVRAPMPRTQLRGQKSYTSTKSCQT
jgi:hypothetical protein